MDRNMLIGAVAAVLIVLAVVTYFVAGSRSSATYTTTALQGTPYTTVGASITGQNINTTTVSATSTAAAGAEAHQVNLESSPDFGSYLANSTGFALYTYARDAQGGGASACYSTCAANWPPFYVANLTVAPGLNASAFGAIDRTDGTRQLTYNGWPLYLFVGDHRAGDINGNGVGNFKLAVK